MTMTSYPYTAQATTDQEYSRIAREWRRDGVVGNHGGTDLKIGPGSGLVSTMQPGYAITRGFVFRNTAVENLTAHATAPTSGSRIDRVVLRLNLNNPIGSRLLPAILTGVSSTGTPALPALTQQDEPGTWEFPLYRVAIGTNATTLSTTNYTDDRDWIGHDVGVWTTERRPSSPRLGMFGLNVTLGYYEYWNGTAWARPVGALPDWTDVQNKPAKYPDADKIDGREIFVQTAQPGGVDGDIWIKI